MFSMYINNLNDYLTYSKASLYADAMALCTSGKTQVDIMRNLNLKLTVVNKWLGFGLKTTFIFQINIRKLFQCLA